MAVRALVVGIDLAGSSRRNTGVAVLAGKKFLHISLVRGDGEIISLIRKYKPALAALDAPLTLPTGRRSIEQKNRFHFRQCDIKLRNEGIRFFPMTLGPMRMLTKRGMLLKRSIVKTGVRVIEVFPGATYDILGIQRKDKRQIADFYRENGFEFENRNYTQDELDGMCCAYTALLVLMKKARAFSGKDGAIWVPKPGARQQKA